MRARVRCICAMFLFAAGAIRAQQSDQDPIGQSFFAPELVIQHQEAIGLSPEQKDYFKTEIRQAQLKFTELQWNRIKNKLTAEQQGKLLELRSKPTSK